MKVRNQKWEISGTDKNNEFFFFCTSDFRTVTPDSGIRSRGTVLLIHVSFVYTGMYCTWSIVRYIPVYTVA